MAPQPGGPGNGMASNHGNAAYLSGQAAVAAALKQQQQQQLIEQQKQFILGQRQQQIMAQQVNAWGQGSCTAGSWVLSMNNLGK